MRSEFPFCVSSAWGLVVPFDAKSFDVLRNPLVVLYHQHLELDGYHGA